MRFDPDGQRGGQYDERWYFPSSLSTKGKFLLGNWVFSLELLLDYSLCRFDIVAIFLFPSRSLSLWGHGAICETVAR